jgi:3-phenylpropionate/trans-cinnamate dioxygenase ferredoxin subunit
MVDGVINVVLDDAPPNLPPGVTIRAAGEAAL